MDRDTFITSVYYLVDNEYKKLCLVYRVRHAGFAPELSDAEVMTMEICGEYFKLPTDTDLYDYFAQHYRHFFPKLTDRSSFVRQGANLWQFKAELQRRLPILSGQATDPVQPIDTLPLPVCTYTRARRASLLHRTSRLRVRRSQRLALLWLQVGAAYFALRPDQALSLVGSAPARHQPLGTTRGGLARRGPC
jgi:hypothetical protein